MIPGKTRIRIVHKQIKQSDDIFAMMSKPSEPDPEVQIPESVKKYGIPKDPKDWEIPW